MSGPITGVVWYCKFCRLVADSLPLLSILHVAAVDIRSAMYLIISIIVINFGPFNFCTFSVILLCLIVFNYLRLVYTNLPCHPTHLCGLPALLFLSVIPKPMKNKTQGTFAIVNDLYCMLSVMPLSCSSSNIHRLFSVYTYKHIIYEDIIT